MTDRLLLLGLACVGFWLTLLATLLTGPSVLGVLLASASLAGFVIAVWLTVDVWRARRAARLPQPAQAQPRFQLRALDQTEYAFLLGVTKMQESRFNVGLGTTCRRCGQLAKHVRVDHPIWDGPFDNDGSGVVDCRFIWWCLKCDGFAPPAAGAPIRLPYLDNLPIRLLPELYDRPAFRALPGPVERYVPPAPAPAKAADPDTETTP